MSSDYFVTDVPDRSVFDNPLGIPRYFPQMPVRVLEVARVTAPKGGVRWFYDNCAYPPGLFHYLVDFDLRRNVVSNGELGRTWATESDPRIMSNALSRPKREFQTRLQVKERNCPILELCADNAFGPQAKAITLEADGPLQIINTDGDESDPRVHA
jgi:hypothetical protein